MDRLSDLALFLRVLELGSISAAARSIDVSAAVASLRMQRLERDLGVRLLHRTTRSLHATAEGQRLAERGRELLQEFESLSESVRRDGDEVRGLLRVSLPASFGRRHISPLLPQFLARHPLLQLNVHLSDQYVDLVESGFDLAIRIGELADSSLVARRLAPSRRVLCASPDYLKRHGIPRKPADLAAHNCLILSTTAGRQDSWPLRDAHGDITQRISGNFESNLGEVLRDAAVAGVGIGMKSTWDIAEDLRAGRLRVVLPNFPARDVAIHALMPQRRLVPLKVRVFVDYLAAQFGDPPFWDRGLGRYLRVPVSTKTRVHSSK